MKLLSPAAAVVLALSLFSATSLAAQLGGAPAERVTPTELLANKERLTNKPVTVEGILTNEGTNFFRDLRVVLKDDKGAGEGVLVRPWLPAELPARPSSVDKAPATLSDFLGRKVVITGVLTDDVVRNVGPTKVLRVESARVVE